MELIYNRQNFEKLFFLGIAVLTTFAIFESSTVEVLGQNIKLANGVLSSPVINSLQIETSINSAIKEELKITQFNKTIREKYQGGVIYSVDDGVKHIKLTKYYHNRPVRLNIVEADLSLNNELGIKPVTASRKLLKRSTITTMAKKSNSIVAINATYFKPQTGCPLGTLMVDGELLTGPIYDRVAMGFFDNRFDMDRVKLDAKLNTKNGIIKIDNINQPRTLSTNVLLYTDKWGELSPKTPKYGMQISVQDSTVQTISPFRTAIPAGGKVLVGPKSKLGTLRIGDKVNFDIKTIPDWENVNHIISGGPYLVKDGDIYVDMTAQRLASIGGRNPRSAIGYTRENKIIIVTADGREGSSIGLTLIELAHLMKSFGCVNAMNLDGGGSTVMYVGGQVVNKPAIKGGIALSNVVGIYK